MLPAQRKSVLTCPACASSKLEIMPTDYCQWFYPCEACGEVVKPKPGDCCVFCSYGSVKCPPRGKRQYFATTNVGLHK